MRRQHLDSRLRFTDLETGAYGGLQDSAPRSALIALHARVAGVAADSWEDRRLVQIWFRGADYVVPRADVGVFTLGAMPREGEQRDALDALADQVLSILDGNERPTRQVGAQLGNQSLLRFCGPTGKVHIRWDARTITVRPAEPADIDPEDARRELARRYLRWLGPGDVFSFARWAGVTIADSQATWAAIQAEIIPVALEGRAAWILAEDEPAVREHPVPGFAVRLLPLGDPYLWPSGGMGAKLPADLATALSAAGVAPRVVNSLGGRILAEGAVVGAWARSGGSFTILPFDTWRDHFEAAVLAEASSIATMVEQPFKASWLTRRSPGRFRP